MRLQFICCFQILKPVWSLATHAGWWVMLMLDNLLKSWKNCNLVSLRYVLSIILGRRFLWFCVFHKSLEYLHSHLFIYHSWKDNVIELQYHKYLLTYIVLKNGSILVVVILDPISNDHITMSLNCSRINL